MAVPTEFSTVNISGKFVMNKTLSSDIDDMLRLQGVGWLTRKAIGLATITLDINHYRDDEAVEHIDISQTLTGGIPGTTEERTLDWNERTHEDYIFGAVIGKSRRVKVEEIDVEFLKEGWTPDAVETGLIESYVESDTPKSGTTWIARQIWGIEVINDQRSYARHIMFTGPQGEALQKRLISSSDPRPLLNIAFTWRRWRLRLPIESTLIKSTVLLTKPWIFAVFCAAYIISLSFFIRTQSFLTPSSSYIGCTSTYWLANDGCGLNGEECEPFSNSTFDFRCPSQCMSVILQNPRTIGAEEMAYVPLIVGGGDDLQTYRGDSFICAAAMQAGLFSDSRGGCATLSLIGNYTNFIGRTAHGLYSIGFPTIFPLSFRFEDTTTLTHCRDLRNFALAFDIIITCILMMILRPHPLALFWCLVCIGFWHVSLFSQPQSSPPNISTAFEMFLPALFICYGFWRLAFRFTLPLYRRAPIEWAIWYLAPFWAGVLTNLTFDKVPINRLTASDIHQRAGGITALVIIVVIVALMVFNQIRVIRKTGWLPHYFKWYVIGGLVVIVLSLLPGLELRIHHYIIAMVLIPGTAFPTRLSAIYQGFLLGTFLNGGAAFGFDSILQTAAELQQDATSGSALPSFVSNSSNWNASIPWDQQVIAWHPLPNSDWDGFSLLVDDVERYVGTALSFSLAAFNASLQHFFRLALTEDGSSGDYTHAAILFPNGTFVDPAPGATY
ncbi:hypothetical protein FISHEDRAFT_66807 [Fistulina hepatica ATCC 64428]|uniref:LCCL domain-containing protein n=1 Tax=Fistulina hepatica ATCC 64428 TaxID=1128425 RepID=A0A0D7A5T7_9AGAR|nr:hypothetical protein FISHEDRAFT_66807 [Fistulina hepatica ATCC 64428]